ncbi:MAG: DUF72 domain-containing protein [Candidatus Bathyarchaeia archaeon]
MIKVGCCGFPTSMSKYFETFNLVELNTTFYRYPHLETVEGWRAKAPKDFEFTVKAHQDISHKAKLKVETSLQAFEKMKQICKALKAKVMLIQTPSSFKPNMLKDAERFFQAVALEKLTLVWETRGPAWETLEARKKLGQVLEKCNVSHVTDPLKAAPAYTSEVAYFRLHGLGKRLYYYQYSDSELQRLKMLVAPYDGKGKNVYVLFNNLAMFTDGLRFLTYLTKGFFPKITSKTSLGSITEVVEKTQYPATKAMLIKKIGWKLVEPKEGEQTFLETLLKRIPAKKYRNAEELKSEIMRVNKISY